MNKTFCDMCGAEITSENSPGSGGRITGEYVNDGVSLGFEIMTALDGIWNKGDFCRVCILKAIAEATSCYHQPVPEYVDLGESGNFRYRLNTVTGNLQFINRREMISTKNPESIDWTSFSTDTLAIRAFEAGRKMGER